MQVNNTARTATHLTRYISRQLRNNYVCDALANIQCVPLATEHGIEDTATKFEQEYVRCVRNEEECVCSVCL